jgi:glutaredoxin 3
VIDKSGTICYIDIHDIDDQPDNEELFSVLEKLEPGARAPMPDKPAVPVESIPEAEVILFCTPWCPDCRRARNFLREKGVDYVEVDITRNRSAAMQVREWAGGFETTPTFKIKDDILVNYNVEKLEKLLEKCKIL